MQLPDLEVNSHLHNATIGNSSQEHLCWRAFSRTFECPKPDTIRRSPGRNPFASESRGTRRRPGWSEKAWRVILTFAEMLS